MSAAADIEYVDRRLDANEARALTDQIKTGVEAVWHLITRAYTERAWDVLGYTSWDDYCTREFGTARLRLPREERSEVVSSLRDSGLSLRAIESATGISRPTIIKDLASKSEVVNSLPPAAVTAMAECIHCHRTLPTSQLYEGGLGYECDPCVSPDADVPDEQELPPLPENYMVPDPKPITGLDGKSYQPARPAPKPSQEPAQPRRRPLTDAAREIGLDLKNITSRLERLLADDRFARNKSEVAPHLRFHLAQAIKVCQDLDEQINQGEV